MTKAVTNPSGYSALVAHLAALSEADDELPNNVCDMLDQAAAAIIALEARIAQLEETERSFYFLCKWIERAKFDDAISASDALGVILHSPAMPWKNGRWDVDHKPYAAKFYEAFPRARTALENTNGRAS